MTQIQQTYYTDISSKLYVCAANKAEQRSILRENGRIWEILVDRVRDIRFTFNSRMPENLL